MPLRASDMEYIKKQYLCCTPMNKFSFAKSPKDSELSMSYETQMKIYENTVGDSESVKYPPRLSYRISFLRALVEKSERDGDEIDDRLYEKLAEYMTLNEDDDDRTHYRQFLSKDGENRIIVLESKNLISDGTTGLRTWQAAFALAEWCETKKSSISDKVVLELGSGVGFTGISVIKSCSPSRYTFSDHHSGVLDMIVRNVRLNFEKNRPANIEDSRTVEWSEEAYATNHRDTDVRIMRLAWSSMSEGDASASWTEPDVVLASDVVYDRSIFDELIKALRAFLRRSGVLVVIAATVRNEETLEEFTKKLDTYDLSCVDEDVPRSNYFLQLDETPIRILRIFNKQ